MGSCTELLNTMTITLNSTWMKGTLTPRHLACQFLCPEYQTRCRHLILLGKYIVWYNTLWRHQCILESFTIARTASFNLQWKLQAGSQNRSYLADWLWYNMLKWLRVMKWLWEYTYVVVMVVVGLDYHKMLPAPQDQNLGNKNQILVTFHITAERASICGYWPFSLDSDLFCSLRCMVDGYSYYYHQCYCCWHILHWIDINGLILLVLRFQTLE